MSYTTLSRFPGFLQKDLAPVSVLAFGQPTLGQARKYPDVYLESRMVRPLRVNFAAYPNVFQEPDLYGRPMGSYADVRPSREYPRLTAFVEAELFPTAFGWMLKVYARHGSQNNLAGTFQFSNYPEACLHLGGWIWFCRQWIGFSWLSEPAKMIGSKRARDVLDFRTIERMRDLDPPQIAGSETADDDERMGRQILRRVFEKSFGKME
jgi:hypothetical protein